MCMFASEVKHVGSTRIFVTSNGRSCFTAYEMEFELPQPLDRMGLITGSDPVGTAMILPVPWLEGEAPIRPVDMSKVGDFFDRLDRMISKPKYRAAINPLLRKKGYLEVTKVGSFDVSVGYSVDDVARANPEVFKLSENADSTLREHYSDGYAFIICALRAGGKIHPLGYISPARSHLFVPTRHEHGDGADSPRWDHDIYVTTTSPSILEEGGQNGDPITNPTVRYEWDTITDLVPDLLPFAGAYPVTKLPRHGVFPNRDLEYRSATALS